MIGAPAFDFKEYMKCYVLFRNLPKLNAQLNQVERDIKEIKNKNQ